jgi:hypothetical protein
MSEQFSIQALNANGIPITPPQDTRSEEGYLKDLTVEGTLTIGAAGEITNTGGDYVLSDSGLQIVGNTTATFNTPKSVNFEGIFGRIGTIFGWATGASSKRLTIDSPVAISVSINDSDVALLTDNQITLSRDVVVDESRSLSTPKLSVSGTTDSTSKDTGAIITEGGIGVEKSAFIGTNLRVLGTTEATSTTTGSTVLSGGLGVAKNAYIGGSLNAPNVTITPISDTDSPYAVLSTDTHIAVDNGLSAVTINLPTGTDGRKVTIYDRGGTALLGTITINRASTNTINGLTSITLTTNYQSVTLLFYGGNWTIIPI